MATSYQSAEFHLRTDMLPPRGPAPASRMGTLMDSVSCKTYGCITFRASSRSLVVAAYYGTLLTIIWGIDVVLNWINDWIEHEYNVATSYQSTKFHLKTDMALPRGLGLGRYCDSYAICL